MPAFSTSLAEVCTDFELYLRAGHPMYDEAD
jgi:hypothetical protein